LPTSLSALTHVLADLARPIIPLFFMVFEHPAVAGTPFAQQGSQGFWLPVRVMLRNSAGRPRLVAQ